jgi:predicted RNA-binding protein with TRAM domain
MKQWHVEHMEKTILKYVSGLSQDATSWEKKQHKKYGSFANVCRQIDYDMKHGVTEDQVQVFLQNLRRNSMYAKVRKNDGALIRLEEVEGHYAPLRPTQYVVSKTY